MYHWRLHSHVRQPPGKQRQLLDDWVVDASFGCVPFLVLYRIMAEQATLATEALYFRVFETDLFL
jgi:hypothetical protein